MPDREDYGEQAQDIASLAERFAGFAELGVRPRSAHRVGGFGGEVAFMGEAVDSMEDAWEVEYPPMTLRLPSSEAGFTDCYERSFTIRGAGEHLVEIRSESTEASPDLLPRVPPLAAEAQLESYGEAYLGFPETAPEITFLDAVDAVLAGGIGNPLEAREIDGMYVMHAQHGEEPRPVWVVELRGIPPQPVIGPAGVDVNDQVPHWQRNHMRNVVDARTGQVLFANNLPQPVPPGSETEQTRGP